MSPSSDTNQETGAPPEASTARRNVAFGRFVKPELYDVFGDHDLGALDPEQKAWMKVERLTETLFDPPKDARFVVDGIGLNPYEFNLVARAPGRLAETAMSRTLGDNDVDDERLAASERSRVHALQTKHTSMTAHLDKLLNRRTDIKLLNRRAKAPGYAHETEDRMKELLSGAWQEFTTMLDVMHVRRNWDDEKRAQAEAALLSYLTQGSQRTRVGRWWAMLGLADNYLGARINILRKRNRQVEDMLTALAATDAESA